VLQGELSARRRNHAAYSLRQFARDLKISPGRLSQILTGKQGISKRQAEKLAHLLGLNKKQTEIFCQLAEAAYSKSPRRREEASRDLKQNKQGMIDLDLDTFSVISDWYHMAILELVSLRRFESDSKWIAKALGISHLDATLAIERLCKSGQLNWQSGKLVPSHQNTATPTDVPSKAIRNFHRGVLKKALVAIDRQEVHQRDFGSILLAIDSRDIPKAKDMLAKFRRQFNDEIGAGEDKDSVYCLSLQFFRLDEK
jgi:uncharacterized protein (TIGR02147 family)